MNRVLISLTARQLLGRRRTALIGFVLALPILIAVIYRFSDEAGGDTSTEEFAIGLVGTLIVTLLLPLVALVLGTAALGAEIEDGTAVFLLTKPIERWRIIAIKTGVAAAATAVLVVPVTMATTWIIHGGPTADGLMLGLGLAALVGAILYCAVFVALSAFTSRALIFGLIYVFVWEAFATNLFNSLRWVSVREYATGWSDAIISVTDTDIYDPRLAVASAVIGSIVVLSAAVAYGTRALSRFEIGERA
ncbi:MAG: ABC transporter permease subunit [Actinomycetia bacterium]|nr:ABC transporter permease subunit [Actinomycetes bacterium]